ncbi:glucosaminidase domain-containing protein [Vineibacter terrae]|uniref:glucosaminidase domain-containing protein n=1 Tax=Vineibacter terrae TaxID=2586908 RepID=UPI002E317A07|nr:glucosaminidase domain-containing protein [Vineibacter terrae]HEX2888904.1 glucosaminidase domain-containing protein [Vineibacter terrae]
MSTYDRRAWTLAMLEAAKPTAARLGVSPEAIVAQAALESNWGKAGIGNNVFGIKADKTWTGKRQLVLTWEHIAGQDIRMQDWFRDYDSLADSIADHFAFLDQNGRYRAHGVFDAKGDEHYFRALKAAGYATAPNYAEALLDMKDSVIAVATGAAPEVLQQGATGEHVIRLQEALRIPADGVFGPQTRAAVMAFQSARGLAADGIVGPATRQALGL